MISREDFIFTIGFDGESAVVDANAKRLYGKLTTGELLEKGLFRAAFSSALYSKKEDEINLVLNAYNAKTGTNYTSANDLRQIFGISGETITKVLSLG